MQTLSQRVATLLAHENFDANLVASILDLEVSAVESLLTTPDSSPPGIHGVIGCPFAFNDAGINNGEAIYHPLVGDVLLNAWVEVDTTFNGTTPLLDIGTFDGANTGLFKHASAAVPLGTADATPDGAGVLVSANGASLVALGGAGKRIAPAKFTIAEPILLVVSQNGQKGGTATGATQGAGTVFLHVESDPHSRG